MNEHEITVIGGGPAGLAAAYDLTKRGMPVMVLEKDIQLGGLSRTVKYRGFRFDIGGHRFFTKSAEVEELWREILPSDFLRRPRLSRIYYDGKFFNYPLRVGNALTSLGLFEGLKVIFSYFGAKICPKKPEETFEDWVSNRFGAALFNTFFRTYTEKVWGISCTTLSADWAAQRIRNLSLAQAVLKAIGIGEKKKVASLINEFDYPRYGPGQMYETMAKRTQQLGGIVKIGSEVLAILHKGSKIVGLKVRSPDGPKEISTHYCFSSMPITDVVLRMQPPAPKSVLESARRLRYRSIITVNLLINQPSIIPDTWVYIHSPKVRASRLQLYKNWSPEMVPDPQVSSVGLEYFCFEGDDLWKAPKGRLLSLAKDDVKKLGFIREEEVLDGLPMRYAKAYPMYERGYQKHLNIVREWLHQFSMLYLIGRYGQFRYNNMDHSIMTALLAVRKMLGENVDPWSVNADAEYQEER